MLVILFIISFFRIHNEDKGSETTVKREGDSVDHYSSGSEGGGISEKLDKENIGSSAHKNGHGSPNNNYFSQILCSISLTISFVVLKNTYPIKKIIVYTHQNGTNKR